jgi:regulator of protease activity HflC (stomatin/prohibitin superfamily)
MAAMRMLPVFVLSLSSAACVVVDAGNVGVQTWFGSVSDKVLEPGVSFPNFNTVTEVSVQQRNFRLEIPSEDARAAISSDMQTVGYSLDVAYFVNGAASARLLFLGVNRAPEAWEDMIIRPSVAHTVSTVFARYTLRELVANREQVRTEVASLLREVITQRLSSQSEGLGGALTVAQVALTNLDYSAEFERMIEATQAEEQRVRLAENEFQRIRIELQRELAAAEAERAAAVERARGEAESLTIRAEAEAAAIRTLADAGLNVNLRMIVERWNGTMPMVLGGSEAPEFMMSLEGLRAPVTP